MELKQYMSMFWRWGWLIALTTLLAMAISYQVSSKLPKTYTATSTLMVGQVLQSTNPNAADLSMTQQLAQTYVLLVKRQPVLQATAQALGLKSWQGLASQVNAAAVPQTQLIQVFAVDSQPEQARRIADELAHQLILQSPTPVEKEQDQRQEFVTEQLTTLQARIKDTDDEIKALENRLATESTARGVQDVQNQISALQQKVATWQTSYANLLNNKIGRINSLTVVEPALTPIEPNSPNMLVSVATAAAVGFVLAISAILLLEYLDDTIKTKEDVERILKLPTLGAISRIRASSRPSDKLVAMRERSSPIAEAYRVVRTNLQFARLRNKTSVVLLTSATFDEGKTTTACNLAIAMAQDGKRVILCDADLRRPSVHRLFGIPHAVGLTSLLLDERMATDDALVSSVVPGLQLLPSGPIPPNPAELLNSEAMKERVLELREMADVVLLDTPALLPIADTTILGALCDGVVLVVDASHTRADVVRQAVSTLDQVGLKVLGVVLNRVKASGHLGSRYYAARATIGPRKPWQQLASAWSQLFGATR